MHLYGMLKDIVIPLISPLVAAVAIILAVKQERKKLIEQHEHSLQLQIKAAERELLALRELYQRLGIQISQGVGLAAEQLAVYHESVNRFFKVFHDSPAAYEKFFDKRSTKIRKNRLPLLIAELEIHMRQLKTRTNADPFVLFGLYLFLYARTDDEGAEEMKILEGIYKKEPKLYGTWWVPEI